MHRKLPQLRSQVRTHDTGTRVELLSNVFKINFSLDSMTKYDVEFDPPMPEDNVEKRKRVFDKFSQSCP